MIPLNNSEGYVFDVCDCHKYGKENSKQSSRDVDRKINEWFWNNFVSLEKQILSSKNPSARGAIKRGRSEQVTPRKSARLAKKNNPEVLNLQAVESKRIK